MAGIVTAANSPKYYWNGGTYGSAAERDAAIAKYKQQTGGASTGALKTAATNTKGSPGTSFDISPTGDISYSGVGSAPTAGSGAVSALKSGVGAPATAEAWNPDIENQKANLQYGMEAKTRADEARLQAEAEQRHIGELPAITAATMQPQVTHGGADPNAEANARAAVFGRAKEQAGQIARSSLDSLSSLMASHGMSGSGIEEKLGADVLGGAAGSLGDVTREQQIQDLGRIGQVSDQTYQGDITQRAQNLGLTPSLMALISSRAY